MKTFDINKLAISMQNCPNVIFSFLFGSSIDGLLKKSEGDIDVAVFLDTDVNLDILDNIINVSQESTGHENIDLSILNNSNVFFCFEVLKGKLLSCNDFDIYSDFFSLKCRMYEYEVMRINRNCL